jgi:hypothetical protein
MKNITSEGADNSRDMRESQRALELRKYAPVRRVVSMFSAETDKQPYIGFSLPSSQIMQRLRTLLMIA